MLVVYLAAMIRSIIALHNLINNKIQNRDAEKNEGGKPEKKKEADKKDGDKDKKDTDKEKKDSDKDKDEKKGKKDSKSK